MKVAPSHSMTSSARPRNAGATVNVFEKWFFEKGSGALANATTRCAFGSNSILHAFAGQFCGNAGHAGDIATRSIEAFDKSGPDRITASAMPIEISHVACLAASAAGATRLRSDRLRRTSSAARSGRRLPWSE